MSLCRCFVLGWAWGWGWGWSLTLSSPVVFLLPLSLVIPLFFVSVFSLFLFFGAGKNNNRTDHLVRIASLWSLSFWSGFSILIGFSWSLNGNMSSRQMAMPARYYDKGLTSAPITEGVLRMVISSSFWMHAKIWSLWISLITPLVH